MVHGSCTHTSRLLEYLSMRHSLHKTSVLHSILLHNPRLTCCLILGLGTQQTQQRLSVILSPCPRARVDLWGYGFGAPSVSIEFFFSFLAAHSFTRRSTPKENVVCSLKAHQPRALDRRYELWATWSALRSPVLSHGWRANDYRKEPFSEGRVDTHSIDYVHYTNTSFLQISRSRVPFSLIMPLEICICLSVGAPLEVSHASDTCRRQIAIR